jgi:hypothetical protein
VRSLLQTFIPLFSLVLAAIAVTFVRQGVMAAWTLPE